MAPAEEKHAAKGAAAAAAMQVTKLRSKEKIHQLGERRFTTDVPGIPDETPPSCPLPTSAPARASAASATREKNGRTMIFRSRKSPGGSRRLRPPRKQVFRHRKCYTNTKYQLTEMYNESSAQIYWTQL